MKRFIIITALTLVVVGSATAAITKTIVLAPGKSAQIGNTLVRCVIPAPTKKPISMEWSGAGSKTLDPFTTTVGQHLQWTHTPTRDFDLGLEVHDDEQYYVVFDSKATTGESYLKPGKHLLEVRDYSDGTWTLKLVP